MNRKNWRRLRSRRRTPPDPKAARETALTVNATISAITSVRAAARREAAPRTAAVNTGENAAAGILSVTGVRTITGRLTVIGTGIVRIIETVSVTGIITARIIVRTIDRITEQTIVRKVDSGRIPIEETEGIDREGNPSRMGMQEIHLRANERVDDLQRNGYRIIQNPEKF